MAKMISEKQKKELLSLKPEEMSVTLITRLFGKTSKIEDGKMIIIEPVYNVRDKMHLDAGEYINKEAIDTTVGKFLFNKLMVEGMIEDIIPNGYFNEVVNGKGIGKIQDYISEGLMEGKIQIRPTLVKWLKNYEFYSMKCVTIFSPSYSEGLLRKNPAVEKEKERLIKNTEIKSAVDMTNIEDNLVKSAGEILKKDTGKTLFDSGARGSFDNDYKNMGLMVGPTAIPGSDGEFNFMKSNYIDGIQKKDLINAGNIVVNAEYPKAIGTREGGYLTKQFFAVYQSIVLDDEGTDCGTKMGLKVTLTKNVISDYYYQNIISGGKLVTLTPSNADQYIGKTVTMRSPMFCAGDKICAACAGKRFYIMGIQNAGLTAGRISNTLLNKSMKNFHNAKVKYDNVNLDDLLINN